MENKTDRILNEVEKAIIGKDDVVQKVLTSILSNGHILLEDVPGVGKTTLAVAFSRALGLDYERMQFTSDSVPSDITGFSVPGQNSDDFIYRPGSAMTNLLLADEINRASSKTQSALLEVMEERQVTVDGVTRPVPAPFIVIATQNPAGSSGTQLLPPSELDRFMIRLRMGYPDHNSLIDILRDRHEGNPLDTINQVTDKHDILKMQKEVSALYVSDSVYDYITSLSEETRKNEDIALGISPRAALALCRMSKARAYLEKRDYVIPEDVSAVFADTCAHRLTLSAEARMSRTNPAKILKDILKKVPMPVTSFLEKA